jgi:hypothetical protein
MIRVSCCHQVIKVCGNDCDDLGLVKELPWDVLAQCEYIKRGRKGGTTPLPIVCFTPDVAAISCDLGGIWCSYD